MLEMQRCSFLNGDDTREHSVLCNQKTNGYLKEVADICGMNKTLTTHMLRHTFATTITRANHVSLQNVSKRLGRCSTKMIRHYVGVLDQNIMEDMQKTSKSLFR